MSVYEQTLDFSHVVLALALTGSNSGSEWHHEPVHGDIAVVSVKHKVWLAEANGSVILDKMKLCATGSDYK